MTTVSSRRARSTLFRAMLAALIAALVAAPSAAHALDKKKREEKKERREMQHNACVFETNDYDDANLSYATEKVQGVRRLHCMTKKVSRTNPGEVRQNQFEVRGLKFKKFDDEDAGKKINRFTGE
jgi:hypothetical protein